MKQMQSDNLDGALALAAEFYDGCKYGCEGAEGYRKSTDLMKFTKCLRELKALGHVDGDCTVFADLGCADGRVNFLVSYFVKKSIGIELDPEILGEYAPRKKELVSRMAAADLALPPDNISLFAGSSLDEETYQRIYEADGVRFQDIDLFYTYITLHDLFGEKIAREARPGALYLVYGFSRVLPRYGGLEILLPDVASQSIAALYVKR